jgi:hypothetical protein
MSDQEILSELKKINRQLAKNNIFTHFWSGMMYSLGYFIGTVTIILVIAFFATRYDWAAILSKSIESTMSKVNWSKVIPQPRIEITSPFSQP